jgi:bifunctional DNase/RNase
MVRSLNNSKALISLTAIIIIIFVAGFYFSSGVEKTAPQTFQLSTRGYTPAKVSINGSTLYFSTECRRLSMEISDTQALSIEQGLEKRIDTRPLTHDIMKDTLDNFGIDVLMARIDSFDNGIYYARIIMQQGENILDIDSRPSDAAAIAVRSDLPVYVKDEIFLSYGEDTCKTEKQG